MPDSSDIGASVTDLARRAKSAARLVATAPPGARSAVLLRAGAALRGPEGDALIAAHALDLANAAARGIAPGALERHRLDRARVDALAERIEHLAALADPIGDVLEQRKLANGPAVVRMRVPLGLVAFVHDAGTAFTADAIALGLKAGNAVLVSSAEDSQRGDRALAAVFAQALAAEGLPKESACVVDGPPREALLADASIDLVVARGTAALVRFATDHARAPVLALGHGVCHVYVDGDADLATAERVLLHAKTQRPDAGNAVDTLLVDDAIAPMFLTLVAPALAKRGIELRADERARVFLPEARPASAGDFDTEHAGLVLGVAVVDGLEGALAHVARHGSRHTEVIVTQDKTRAERWVHEVDAGMVLVNASSRLHDPTQLGLGAELGVATSKVHAYGAVGVHDLCTSKWVAYGDGQVRPHGRWE